MVLDGVVMGYVYSRSEFTIQLLLFLESAGKSEGDNSTKSEGDVHNFEGDVHTFEGDRVNIGTPGL